MIALWSPETSTPPRRVMVPTLAKDVWGDRRTKYATMKSTFSRLNAAFDMHGIPYVWSKVREVEAVFHRGRPVGSD